MTRYLGVGMKKSLAVLAAAALLAGCGDSFGPDGPGLDVRGTYLLTALSFDPQGSLPAVDLLARLETATIPRLVIGTGGRAQLVFENPNTGLITIANASYTTSGTSTVRFDFGSGSNTLYRNVLLSERMTFGFDESTNLLTFTGEAPDGIDRTRLLQLVPEWAGEQLFDPVPGALTVQFSPASSTS